MNQTEELNGLIDICHFNLKKSKKCLKYLVRERLLTKDCIKQYKIGFFPQNPSVLTKYISEDLLNRLNILNYSKGSDFSNYFFLIFPIYSEYGDPVGISGRTLLEDTDRGILGIPKYKNSSYKKANILYGLNHAKKYILESNNVYISEGYFDQIAMTKNDILNSVAICGTAFSQNHFLKIIRYTKKITFILDSDEAGLKSVQRIYSKYINRGIKLRFLRVPSSYKDIDEYFADPLKNKVTFINDFKQIIPDAW
jgi:DNA primase